MRDASYSRPHPGNRMTSQGHEFWIGCSRSRKVVDFDLHTELCERKHLDERAGESNSNRRELIHKTHPFAARGLLAALRAGSPRPRERGHPPRLREKRARGVAAARRIRAQQEGYPVTESCMKSIAPAHSSARIP
jgi:hypothetical protein